MNLAAALLRHERSWPRREAVVSAGRSICYAELASLVRRVAGGLAAAGAGEGDVVGVSLDDTPEHLIAHYAVAWHRNNQDPESRSGMVGIRVARDAE